MLASSLVRVLAALILIASTTAAAEPKGWRESRLDARDDGYRASLWTPDGKRPPERGWPVLVWLHGFSLRGDDLGRLREYGPLAVLDRLPPELAIVAPQLSSKQLLWDRRKLDATLDRVLADLPHDPRRVFVAGASLGAAGASEWAAASPDRFAGLVTLAGAGDPRKAEALAGRPVWMFHGADDAQVPLAKARAFEKALATAGARVSFLELPRVGHDAEALTRAAFLDERVVDRLLALDPRSVAAPRRLPTISRGSVAEVRAEAEALRPRLATFPHRVEVPSNETIHDWIAGLCETPHRRPGTPEGRRGEEWVAARFRELGLDSVTRDPVPIKVWTPRRWKLVVDDREVECFFLLNSGFTDEQGVAAPLVFDESRGLGGLSAGAMKGKIVVARAKFEYPDGDESNPRAYFVRTPDGRPAEPASHAAFPANMLGDFLALKFIDAYERARAAGAVGFVMLTDELRSPDVSLYWPYDAEMKSLPGLYAGRADSPFVERAARDGKRAVLIQTGSLDDGEMGNVWGLLPGRSDELLLVTSHHDAAHRGAVEDASGVAQTLAQIWAWSRLPREQRPLTLAFVAAAGHFYKGQGAYEFAKAHPELLRRCRGVLTLEHLPCREVRLGERGYEPTGRPQPVSIYASPHPALLAALAETLERKPPPFVASVERPLLSVPLSDAAGYVVRSREPESGGPGRDGLPYVSWISAPLYLVDRHDTLDKIDRGRLAATAETVTELVKRWMVLE